MKYFLISTILILTLSAYGISQETVNKRALQHAIKTAGKILNSRDSTLAQRAEAIRKVSEFDHIGAATFLLKRLKKISDDVDYKWLICQPRYGMVLFEVVELEKGFARFRDERIITVLLRNKKKLSDTGRLTLFQGLKGVPGKELDKHYMTLLKRTRQEYKLRIIAIEAAGIRKMKQSLPLIHKLILNTKEPFGVRCSAIRSAAQMPDMLSIEPLIMVLKEKGRIAAEANNALWSITGQRISMPGQWEKWWGNNKDYFNLPSASEVHFNQEIETNQEKQKFYGIPLVGKRVFFVLDRSGSMRDDKKLDGVKKEVERIVQKFGSHTVFNIMFFNHGTHLWKQKRPYMVKAEGLKGSALKNFLVSTSPDGGTKTEEAMYEVFLRINPYADIETIFLLSDGLPNNDPIYVQYSIFHINRYIKIRINTVFISEEGNADVSVTRDVTGSKRLYELTAAGLMKNISEMNDGLFRNLTPKEAAGEVKE